MQASKFSDEFELNFQLYTDPMLASFKAFNLKRKFGVGPKAIVRYLKAMKAGFRQGWVYGDAWQQGGVVLLGADGDVAWSHINDGPGDAADEEMILKQVASVSQ